MSSRDSLERDRRKRLIKEEAKAGVREGHYLLDDSFVVVWVSFYPRTKWWIADASRPRGELIKGTMRPLDEATKARLESWL